MKKRNIKCSECEHSEYLKYFSSYTCKHQNCKDVPIFKGKTHPRCCPLVNPNGYYRSRVKGLGMLPNTQIYFHV